MTTPVPSNLVLLDELDGCAPGTKVRFLGCVDEFVIKTGTLCLKHGFPYSDPQNVAHVNIDHVRDSLKRAEVEVGAWVNVIGYLERRKEKGIFVQAVALWDAGNVDIEAYQKAVQKRTDAT